MTEQLAMLLSLLENRAPEVQAQGIALAEALGPEAICTLLSHFRLRHLPALQQLHASASSRAPIDGLHTLTGLRELDLTHASQIAPPGLSGLRRLHRLDLRGAVPPEVAGLRWLQEVTVRGRDISLVPLAELPRLRHLALRSFGTRAQLASLGQPPSLRTLILEGGQMSEPPEVLYQLTGLQHLTLSDAGVRTLSTS